MEDFSDLTPEQLITRYNELSKRKKEIQDRMERRREYLIRTFSPYILSTHFGIVVAQASELHRLEDRLARIEQGLSSNPESSEPRLTDKEEHILEALGTKCLTGEEIAKKAGWQYNSNFKATLSSLCKRGILENRHPGYRCKRQSENPAQ